VIRGAAIRARREAMGLDLDEVAQATRIPRAHLLALEEERYDALPSGPYAAVYTRAVSRYLGLDVHSSSDDGSVLPPAPPQGAPLWFVRVLAMGSVVALVVLLSSLVWERLRPVLPTVPSADVPDQRLILVARRDTELVVKVDGSTVLDRKVEHGEELEFVASERIELVLEATSHVRLEWNGVAVVPQGRQDAPRTLVFVDDRGVGW
jgi:hypothetical protein